MTATQAPTPGPLSGDDWRRTAIPLGQRVQVDMNDPAQICTVTGIPTRWRFIDAPTAPVEASGSEQLKARASHGEYSLHNFPDDPDADHSVWSIFHTTESGGLEVASGMDRATADLLLAALSTTPARAEAQDAEAKRSRADFLDSKCPDDEWAGLEAQVLRDEAAQDEGAVGGTVAWLDSLEKMAVAAAKRAPGIWGSDIEKGEGSYAEGDEDRTGFMVPYMETEHGKRLFDAHYCDVAEVHEEYDEDGVYAWDEAAREIFNFLAAVQPENVKRLIEMARAHPSPTPAADRVREAIADVISHEGDWRTALTAMDAAEETPEDGSGKPGYWLHQIKVLDRILAALKSTAAKEGGE